MMRSALQTTCPYCGVGCGLRVGQDGSLAGDPAHPANFGKLCSKGSALAETLGEEGRLLAPMIGGRRASWDEATGLIAERFSQTIAEHGPDAVALYVSGQMLTEDYYVANKLMKGFIGSANIDTNSRLCMASSVAGHIRAFGEDIVPGCYEDLDEADLVVLAGSNMAWCHPVLYQRVIAARAKRGTKIVVIDPRRTASCESADVHLALAPGTDVLLFNGLLSYLAANGAMDRDWIDAHTMGFGEAHTVARETAPSITDVAAACDLPIERVAAFYALFAATARTVTLYSQGINQSIAGTDKVNAIINCHLATSRIGRPGAGPFSLTGQPNAMGGREVGGLATQLAAHMDFTKPDDIDRVRRFWNAPRMATRPGLKAVELFDAVERGQVKAIWIIGTNPAASMPRAERVRSSLKKCPFVAVSDCWDTDTTALAHIVLPAAGWSEKDGTVTNSERCISRQRAFRAAPGEARADWRIVADVACRMGFAGAFSYRGPADIFREHASLSAFENAGRRVFDIGSLADLSDDDYDALAPVQWPLPRGERRKSFVRLFADGQFPMADGRARFVSTPPRQPEATDAHNPLRLNTGRIRDQWHTMTRTGRAARLMRHTSEPLLDMHPDDAAERSLVDGALVRMTTRQAGALMRVRIAPEQRRGEIFAPMHWTDRFSAAGPVARLVNALTDPVSGQPDLKTTPAGVEPVSMHWHGLCLTRAETIPRVTAGAYWVKIPMEGCTAFELKGTAPLSIAVFADNAVKELMGVSRDADLVMYADPAKKSFRFAAIDDERLEACLFLAPPSLAIPMRGDLAERLGRPCDGGAALSLLAGAQGASAKSPERIVCACHGVGPDAICHAIRNRGLTTPAAVGEHLQAGTLCGSCIPEIEKLLATVRGSEGVPTSP